MGSSTTANAAEFQSAGKPTAEPVYLVDANGNPISSTNALNVNASFSASSVAINDPTVTTQKMGVNAQGQITSQIADSAGTNIAGVDSSHNLLTKVNAALPTGTNVIGGIELVDSAGTNKASISVGGAVKVDGSAVTQPVSVQNGNANGQATMANSSPVVVASDQSKLPTKASSGDFVDGSIVTLGTEADAAASSDSATATYMAHFKRLQAKVPTIGQQTKANSLSVTMASDQGYGTWTSVYTTTQTGVSSWSGSGSITGLGIYERLYANIYVSAISGTSIQFVISRIDSSSNSIFLGQSSAMTTTGSTEFAVGPGLTIGKPFGGTIKLSVNLVAITSVTFTIEVLAR